MFGLSGSMATIPGVRCGTAGGGEVGRGGGGEAGRAGGEDSGRRGDTSEGLGKSNFETSSLTDLRLALACSGSSSSSFIGVGLVVSGGRNDPSSCESRHSLLLFHLSNLFINSLCSVEGSAGGEGTREACGRG